MLDEVVVMLRFGVVNHHAIATNCLTPAEQGILEISKGSSVIHDPSVLLQFITVNPPDVGVPEKIDGKTKHSTPTISSNKQTQIGDYQKTRAIQQDTSPINIHCEAVTGAPNTCLMERQKFKKKSTDSQ